MIHPQAKPAIISVARAHPECLKLDEYGLKSLCRLAIELNPDEIPEDILLLLKEERDDEEKNPRTFNSIV